MQREAIFAISPLILIGFDMASGERCSDGVLPRLGLSACRFRVLRQHSCSALLLCTWLCNGWADTIELEPGLTFPGLRMICHFTERATDSR